MNNNVFYPQCYGTRHSTQNYGLMMTGSAAGGPLTALLTQHLSPLLGHEGMFLLLAAVSTLTTTITLALFPAHISADKILKRIENNNNK